MKKSRLVAVSTLLSFFLFFFLAAQQAAGQNAVVSSPPLPDNLSKFFSSHCTPCHFNNGRKMAMVYVNFDDWTKNTPEKQTLKAERISNMLNKGKMPPAGERKKRPEIVPTKEQVAMVTAWAETLKPAKK